MAIKLGLTDIADAKLGTTQVDKIYLGSTEVWSNAPAPAIKALKFTSTGSQTLSVNTAKIGTLTPSFEYSLDNGATWTSWNPTSSGATPISFGSGTDLYLRGMNNTLSSSLSAYVNFVFSTSSLVSCSGNVMHLLDYTQDLTSLPTNSGMIRLFQACYVLVSAPELPATTLTENCYFAMFANCSSLIEPPVLPASGQLPYRCYYSMFFGCTSLEKLPYLGGVTGGTEWGVTMFKGCSNIKLSTTQTGSYQNEYIINAVSGMPNAFQDTGGTFTGSPTQGTYYTSNPIIGAPTS